jgi:hypothetical protein
MRTENERLEYLRGELRSERISYGELSELQDLVPFIDPGDVELLEAAGVPEHPSTHGHKWRLGVTGAFEDGEILPAICTSCGEDTIVTIRFEEEESTSQ